MQLWGWSNVWIPWEPKTGTSYVFIVLAILSTQCLAQTFPVLTAQHSLMCPLHPLWYYLGHTAASVQLITCYGTEFYPVGDGFITMACRWAEHQAHTMAFHYKMSLLSSFAILKSYMTSGSLCCCNLGSLWTFYYKVLLQGSSGLKSTQLLIISLMS